MIFGGNFDLDEKRQIIQDLESEMALPTFWDDKKKSEMKISQLSNLKNLVEKLENIKKEVVDSIELVDLAITESDEKMKPTFEATLNEKIKEVDDFETLLLLNGECDKCNCTVEIHSGAGGTEACDWAMMLYRMYLRWCEKHDYKTELIDYQVGTDEVGIKSATILVKGINSYGYLKNEKGIHRLIRLSPFDSNNRRHTSFASVDVIPEFDNTVDIELNEFLCSYRKTLNDDKLKIIICDYSKEYDY